MSDAPLLGFRTSGWKSWPLDLCLTELRAIGYRAMEFCLEHPDATPRAMTRERCVEVAGTSTELDLQLSSVSYHGKRDHPALKRQATLRMVEVAERLLSAGAPVDVLVVGSALASPQPGLHSERFESVTDLMKEVCSRAADLGLVVAMEPEPDTVVEGARDMDRLLDRVDHPALRVNLDLAHAHLIDGDPVTSIRHFGPRIAHVHIDDVAGGEHCHLMPGQGDLDIPGSLRALTEVGFTGPLVIDLFDIGDDPPGWARAAFGALLGQIK